MNAVVSRYRFSELADGFSVEGDERPPVEVRLFPTWLEGRFVGESAGGSREQFGFFNFSKLLDFVVRGLMRDWRPIEGGYGARKWALEQTARAIARRLREQWLRLLAQCDPVILAVQKAIFATTFSDAPLASEPALYKHSFLVRDIINYPAAAIAPRNAWTLTRELPVRRLTHSEQARQLRLLAQNLALGLRLVATPDDPDGNM